MQVWDPKRDFRCVQTLTGHKGEISAICVNSKYIISGSFDKTIKVRNSFSRLPFEYLLFNFDFNVPIDLECEHVRGSEDTGVPH